MGTSGSEILHTILSNYRIGYRFTFRQLMGSAHAMGYSHVNEGITTGFINRALNKGMIRETNNFMKPTAKHAQRLRIYELIAVVDWNFTKPSPGSPKGRTINKPKRTKSEIMIEEANQLDLPIVDMPVSMTSVDEMSGVPEVLITDEELSKLPILTVDQINQMTKRDLITEGVWDRAVKQTEADGAFTDINKTYAILKKMDEAVMPLSEQLLKIATQVEILEHRSLKDYSDEELLNELKRRIK